MGVALGRGRLATLSGPLLQLHFCSYFPQLFMNFPAPRKHHPHQPNDKRRLDREIELEQAQGVVREKLRFWSWTRSGTINLKLKF